MKMEICNIQNLGSGNITHTLEQLNRTPVYGEIYTPAKAKGQGYAAYMKRFRNIDLASISRAMKQFYLDEGKLMADVSPTGPYAECLTAPYTFKPRLFNLPEGRVSVVTFDLCPFEEG